MKRLAATTTIVVLLVGLSSTQPARGSEPPAGHISRQSHETAWKGGPFMGSSADGCTGTDDPVCDHYSLAVDAAPGTVFVVTVMPPEGTETDLNLFVFYPDGTEAARSAGPEGQESVFVEHRADHGLGTYEIRVQPALATAGSTYDGLARFHPEASTDLTRSILPF